LVDVVGDGVVEVTDRVGDVADRQGVEEMIDGIDLRLTRMQAELLQAATAGRDARRLDLARMGDLVEATRSRVVRMPWAAVDRHRLSELARAGVEVRGLVRPGGGLPESQNEPDLLALFGRSW
jgi:prolyl-tRNA synthetase